MTFIERLSFLFSRKQSQARIATSVTQIGQPVTSPANYTAFSREGYQKNVTVFRCVSMIARACAGIKWELYVGGREVENHPLLTLMKRPNPQQGWASFMESYAAYFAISGNSFLEGVGPGETSPPRELYSIRPDGWKIVPNAIGGVGQYKFKAAQTEKTWNVDPVTGKSRIKHSKTFHPTDLWFGMSPIEAVMLNVDQANSANIWNLALLQNFASPSGVLKVETTAHNPGGMLTTESRAALQQSLEEKYSGPKRAGRPMLLEGGMSWQQISLSPKEMEWLESKKVTSADICNAFGVPAMLLGFGQTTYANYSEAKDAFYIDTILPLMDFFESELNHYFQMWFGPQIELKYDRDDIEALTKRREVKYSSVNTLNFLTQNEKRAMAGFEPAEGWDVFLIGNQVGATPDDFSFGGGFGSGAPPPSLNTNEPPPVEDEPEDEIEDEEEEKGFKSFNRLNRIEKVGSWRKINALRKRLAVPFARALEQDFEELARSLEKAFEGKEPRTAEFALQKAIDEGMADISKTIQRNIKFSVQDFGQGIFREAKHLGLVRETKANERTWQQWADSYVRTRTAKAISEIEGTTRKQVTRVVRELVQEAINPEADIDVARELRSKFSDLAPGRASTIARTEVAMASNNATLEAAKALEIPGLQKEWVSVQDDRTRDGGDGNDANHLEMNGVRVELDQKFTVPPDADMDGPGDPAGGADQVCNCRCVLTFTATR